MNSRTENPLEENEPIGPEVTLAASCAPELIEPGSAIVVSVTLKCLGAEERSPQLALAILSDDGEAIVTSTLRSHNSSSRDYRIKLHLPAQTAPGTYRLGVMLPQYEIDAWRYLYVVPRGGVRNIQLQREALQARAEATTCLEKGDLWAASQHLDASALQYEAMGDDEFAAQTWTDLSALYEQCGQVDRARDLSIRVDR